jgi:hypothetical protein
MMVYFMTIRNILWPFGIIFGRLVKFVAIGYIFSILVCLDQEKSGNPGFDPDCEVDFQCHRTESDCPDPPNLVALDPIHFDKKSWQRWTEKLTHGFLPQAACGNQGCQIFLGTIYQNVKNTPNDRYIPNGNELYPITTKYTRWPYNLPTSSISRPSKIYPSWDFSFENMPSGNPGNSSTKNGAKLKLDKNVRDHIFDLKRLISR